MVMDGCMVFGPTVAILHLVHLLVKQVIRDQLISPPANTSDVLRLAVQAQPSYTSIIQLLYQSLCG